MSPRSSTLNWPLPNASGVACHAIARDPGARPDCPAPAPGDAERKKTLFAGVIGAGIRFGGKTAAGFSVEGRYVYGLTDLKPSTVTSSESYKTRTFMILAGIHF